MQKRVDVVISELLGKPIVYFAKLYGLIRPIFDVISNSIYTNPKARSLFDDLKVQFFRHIQNAASTIPNSKDVEKLQAIIDKYKIHKHYHVCCLALYSALGRYIVHAYGEELRHTSIKVGDITISPKPPNPIHKNAARPLSPNYGTEIQDIVEIFDHISIIEKTSPEVLLCQDDALESTNVCLRERIRQGLRIAVTPFMAELEVEIESHLDSWPAHEATPFWFKRVVNGDAAKARLTGLLELCIDQRVAVLVLPELTIDPDLLNHLREWLRKENTRGLLSKGTGLVLIAAGSFHMNDSPDGLLNISTLLNHKGEDLLTHHKMKRFKIREDEATASPEIQRLLKISQNGGYECIRQSQTLKCIDTPLGRIAICICIDYFHKMHQAALQNSGINLFLVPAMTHTVTKFWYTAESLGDANLAATFVSNSSYIARKTDGGVHEKGASFYYLPARENPLRSAVGRTADLLIFELGVN